MVNDAVVFEFIKLIAPLLFSAALITAIIGITKSLDETY